MLVAGMLPNWHRGWFYQKHGQITLEVLKILSQRSGEMAQHNNTATPDGLSLVPRTHMMGGQNLPKLSSDLHICKAWFHSAVSEF